MDPYKVLGVSPDADEETIKKAYRSLVKKYHPDRYANSPMADMATEKLKEINKAYDMITNKKNESRNEYGGYYSGYGGAQYSRNYSVSYESVRMLISMHRLSEAEAMLSQLPQNAEWNYLMGLICINRGWYDRGREYIKKAVSMDPANLEYSQTLNSFNAQSRDFKTYRTEYIDCCGANPLLSCLCTSVVCSRCCCC